MNKQNTTLIAIASRALLFLAIAIVGSVLYEVVSTLIRPTIWSDTSILLIISMLVVFVVAGALFASEGNVKSRAVSGATLLLLGLIMLRVGHSVADASYLLGLGLVVALAGALPVLHRKSTSKKRTVLFIFLAAILSIAISVLFAYAMIVIDRTALY